MDFYEKYHRLVALGLLVLFNVEVSAQQVDSDQENLSPYDLMSSYYSDDFRPFKRRNVYMGLSFSLQDKASTNVDQLIQRVIDGENRNYDFVFKGGYYIGNYAMVGLNFKYRQDGFEGELFRDPDTVNSQSITRGYELAPTFRSSVPLTANERLSFFTEIGLALGVANSLSRDIKNTDQIDKSYSTDYNLRIGLSPGITFFAIENFAFEVQLDVLGYELGIRNKTVNGIDESRQVNHEVNFKIDILSLNLGLAYYLLR